MGNEIDTTIRQALAVAGLAKLPPVVIAELASRVRADVASAVQKSIAKRTKPTQIARLFTECVLGGQRGLQGGNAPLDQLGSANPDTGETATLIGTHSEGPFTDFKQADTQ